MSQGNDQYAQLIDGILVAPNATYAVRNPATGRTVGHAPICTQDELDAAAAAARRAGPAWAGDEERRRGALRAAAEIVRENASELALLLTAEQGKLMREAHDELSWTANSLETYSRLELPGSRVPPDLNAGVGLTLNHEPFGVVGVISPWNYPLIIAINRVAPALLVGNTVLLKPSPRTPLTTLKLADLLRGTFPKGVLNVVSGEDDLGSRLVEHPDVAAISFTGSTKVGKLVAEAAGRSLKRVLLELGGNDPAVVLPDVDVASAADGIAASALENCGQVCYCVKRVYVPRRIADRFTEALADKVRSVTVGNGLDPNVGMGAMNNEAQLQRVSELVEEAVAQGARVVTGGSRAATSGLFYLPTILTNCDGHMRIVSEEQFGPVIPIMVYDSLDEVIAASNASPYGLGASVWGRDEATLQMVAEQLSAGSVWINCHGVVGPAQPHGGTRESAIGVVGSSTLALLGLTDLKVIARVA